MKIEEKERLKTIHTGNFLTLFEIYQSDKRFYKSWLFLLSVIISVVLVLLCVKYDVSFFTLMNDHLYGIIFTIIPCLLGFNLGAFILIVGFGSSDILKRITKPLSKQKDFSFYQKMISVMGMSVLIQIITLMFNFLFQLCSFVVTPDYLNLFFIINPICCFLLIFLTLYSLAQLLIVVKHVFMFGQTIHFNIQFDAISNHESNLKD